MFCNFEDGDGLLSKVRADGNRAFVVGDGRGPVSFVEVCRDSYRGRDMWTVSAVRFRESVRDWVFSADVYYRSEECAIRDALGRGASAREVPYGLFLEVIDKGCPGHLAALSQCVGALPLCALAEPYATNFPEGERAAALDGERPAPDAAAIAAAGAACDQGPAPAGKRIGR